MVNLLPQASVPQTVILDASVVVAWVVKTFHQASSRQGDQAEALVTRIARESTTAILTPTSYSDCIHALIRLRYQRVLRERRNELMERYGTRITSWVMLYKHDISILRQHAVEFEWVRQSFASNNIAVASPNDLTPVAADQPYDRELLRLIGRYGLDTSDCLILMEAARLGVRSIVTMDRDLLRARDDFDIYTW